MNKENYYRLDIQGLRAIAVLSVIIFHINPDIFPNGFIGVDIFFVISGYLIADILLRKRHKGTKAIEIIKQFYFSRFNRIFPAYLFMLLGVSLVSAIFFIPDDFSAFFKSLEKAFVFTSNQYFANFGDYFSIQIIEQPLLHSWSLSVESQFYLIIPFLILFIPKRYLSILLMFFILLLSGLAEYYFYSREIKQSIYYGVQFRLPEFFIGILGALYVYEKRPLPLKFFIIGLFLLISALVLQSSLGFFPGVRAFIPSIATVLLLTSHHYENPISKILTNKTLVYVGNISYSLYLWHWPILVFMRYCGYEVTSIFEILIFIIITLMLSLFSYYLIEKKDKSKFSFIWHYVTCYSNFYLYWKYIY